MGLGESRPELQRASVAVGRLGIAAQGRHDVAEIEPGLRKSRFEFQRGDERLLGLAEPTGGLQRQAEIGQRPGILRLQARKLAQPLDRLVETAGLQRDDAAHVQGVRLARIEGEHRVADFACFGDLAGTQQRQRLAQQLCAARGLGAASVRRSHPARSASRSVFLSRSVSLFSCPQAAKMSRPRGVRTGEA